MAANTEKEMVMARNVREVIMDEGAQDIFQILQTMSHGQFARDLEKEYERCLWDIRNSDAAKDFTREIAIKLKIMPHVDGKSALVSGEVRAKLSVPEAKGQIVMLREVDDTMAIYIEKKLL